MELETREDYVMEGGGQNWHTYQNYLQVIKKAGEEPVDHYFEPSVYDEKSQLEMEAYFPELTETQKAAIGTMLDESRRMGQQLKEQAPKVLFADAVTASSTSILIGELAKLIKQNGVEIGQTRLFKWLRENGFLMRDNMPTQYAMERGLFVVTERTINNPDGSVRITRTTKVTGKGQTYFINRFLAAG